MKKALSLLVFMLITSFVMAQAKFGIKMHYTSAKLNASAYGISGNTTTIRGIDGGVFAEFTKGPISFQPGIVLTQKGGTGNFEYAATSTGYISTISDIKINYLEVPLNFLYNFQLKPGKVFFGVGPYLGYALSGKSNHYNSIYNNSGAFTESTTSDDITFGSSANDIKAFDYGVNLQLGFIFNQGVELGFGTGLGMANLSNESAVTVHNQLVRIGIGYFFK
jgi:hypothetical protein